MIPNINDNSTGMADGSFDERLEQEQHCHVDIHCHCLPAVDDGPATIAESLTLCQALVNDGITTVIATPHQLGRFSGYNEAPQIRENVFVLNEALESSGIALTVFPGGDVRVDERICRLLETDKILTLADGDKYILLELPSQIFIDIEPLLAELSAMGIQPIISHPERHFVLAQQSEILLKWLEYSAHLQVTAGSLLGQFGADSQKAGWHFLSSGMASLVATDSHDPNSRRPCMRAAFERISIELGEPAAHRLCIRNPLKVLTGQKMPSVYPIKTEEMSR